MCYAGLQYNFQKIKYRLNKSSCLCVPGQKTLHNHCKRELEWVLVRFANQGHTGVGEEKRKAMVHQLFAIILTNQNVPRANE